MVTATPQWATPQRQEHLVKLFYRSGGFCVFGEKLCPFEDHHYPNYMETVIDAWKAEDREARAYLWKLEQLQLHDGTYGRYGSSFDPVARDCYYQTRPDYYFLGFGVSVESKKRIAVIRVPSTYIRLYVEVSQVFEGASISRNKRRKMARYHSKPPLHIWEEVDNLCSRAVAAYWASR